MMVTDEVSVRDSLGGRRAGLRRGERDEGDGDRDEAEGLGQCDTEEGIRAAEAALEFGLTRATDSYRKVSDPDDRADMRRLWDIPAGAPGISPTRGWPPPIWSTRSRPTG